MFNKEYPKSCTMIDTSFEGSHINIKKPTVNSSGDIFGCGHWQDEADAGISCSPLLSKVFSNTYCPPFYGFRGGVYVS